MKKSHHLCNSVSEPKCKPVTHLSTAQLNDRWAISDSTRHLMGTYDISLKSDRGCWKVLVRSKVNLQEWKNCALSCLGSILGFLFLSALEFIATTCRPSFNKRSGSLESRYFGFFLFQWQFKKKWRNFLKSTSI